VPIPGIQGGGADTNNVGRTTTVYQLNSSGTLLSTTYSADILGDTANICNALA
jgi:hypothetical protein